MVLLELVMYILTNTPDGNPLICSEFNGTWKGGVWLNGFLENATFEQGLFVNGYAKNCTFGI